MHFSKKITFGLQIYPFVCIRTALLSGTKDSIDLLKVFDEQTPF